MSVEQVMARVSELQAALSGGVAAATAATAATAQPSVTGTSFDSILGQQTGALTATQSVAQGGSVGQRIVALAQQELGVSEQPPGSNDSPRIAQYREATAGSGVGPWCAYFTSWLAKSSGAPLGEQGQGFGSVDALYAWAQRTGRAVQNGAGVTPSPGNLIVFDEHIGVVESVDADGTVHTIEGNSSNQVIRRTHSAGEALGYVNAG
ncbi:MAG: CHAP domain-containing protein [Patulibacter sp.]